MGKSRHHLSVLVLIGFFALPLYGAPRHDLRGNTTIDYFTRYATVTIELDRIFFDPGDDIPVHFKITNTGYRTLRIYPFSDNRSFQFLVVDKKGREVIPVELPDTERRIRETGVQVVSFEGEPVKEIILHPEESFERLIYLNDTYSLKAGEEYRISGYFYPDARHEFFVRSNNLARVRIGKKRETIYFTDRSQYHHLTGGRSELTPEETIYLFLSAELNHKWENYLKYIETDKFITSYDKYASRYAIASAMERPSILDDFKDYLTTRKDEMLKRFRVSQTDYDRDAAGQLVDNGRGYVTVVADRETRGYVVHYEYKYTLERSRSNDAFWKIVAVSARLIQ